MATRCGRASTRRSNGYSTVQRKLHRWSKADRYCGGRWSIAENGTELFRPSRVKVERYRFRGGRILLPWMSPDELGDVGRFARSDYDEPASLCALEEDLANG